MLDTLRQKDFIGQQKYTRLQINTRDVMDRTPLVWVSLRWRRPSDRHAAGPWRRGNTLDIQHFAPFCHVICVRLLLEAGADTNIAAVHGYKTSNGLNITARNASSPLIPKTLLDFGANIESCGVDGMTTLIHASQRDNANFTFILLEYGANITAISFAGQTLLTVAEAYNSYNVLRLLLNRWPEYSECPCLTGPHLLQIVGLHVDLETIAILISTDQLRLKHDSSYSLEDLTVRLSERPDATEKLIIVFDELMAIIKQEPTLSGHHGTARLMEAGLAHSNTSDSDNEVFEHALESIHLGEDSVHMADRPTFRPLKPLTS